MVHALAAGPALVAGSGHDDRARGTRRGWRAHTSTVGSSLATLLVIVASAVLAQNGGIRVSAPDPTAELTELGQRALADLPLAYQADDAVVVPSATDPSMSYAVDLHRIVGYPVQLGAQGLVEYGRFSSSADAPAWTSQITEADRVFADVGPLWLACTAWPGQEQCSASVLMYQDGNYYFLRSGLGASGFADADGGMRVFTFDSVNDTGLAQLLIGGVARGQHEGVADVRLTLADGSEVSAWTTTSHSPGGETIWWREVSVPVDAVTAYDGRGDVVTEVRW
jgi:hypothetical protein